MPDTVLHMNTSTQVYTICWTQSSISLHFPFLPVHSLVPGSSAAGFISYVHMWHLFLRNSLIQLLNFLANNITLFSYRWTKFYHKYLIFDIFFIHSFVGHIGCFHYLAIVSSATVNIQIFLSYVDLDEHPGVEELGHWQIYFQFFEKPVYWYP